MVTIRLALSITLWSWVAKIKVVLYFLFITDINSSKSVVDVESRLAVGSSARINSGIEAGYSGSESTTAG